MQDSSTKVELLTDTEIVEQMRADGRKFAGRTLDEADRNCCIQSWMRAGLCELYREAQGLRAVIDGQNKALETVAPSFCLRCEWDAPPTEIEGNEGPGGCASVVWFHGATTRDGMTFPEEECGAGPLWAIIAASTKAVAE